MVVVDNIKLFSVYYLRKHINEEMHPHIHARTPTELIISIYSIISVMGYSFLWNEIIIITILAINRQTMNNIRVIMV